MFRTEARSLLRDIVEYLDRTDPEWRATREILNSSEPSNLYRIIAMRLEDILEDYRYRGWFYNEHQERLLARQESQLDRLEKLISDEPFSCRFAEGKEGGPWFAELITMLPTQIGSGGSGDNKVLGDSFAFSQHLKNAAAKSKAIVIVDPYALAAEDDTGAAVSARSTIRDIVLSARDIDPVHLHLYCRKDTVEIKEWEGLQKDVKDNKLFVYFGDFHDRYVFFGRDKHKNASCRTENWHGSEFWSGLAFGASLNGIGKRPTYVLDFKEKDVKQLIEYIDSVVSKKFDLDTLKNEKHTKDEERARAKAKKGDS